jgi:hypothetical protein
MKALEPNLTELDGVIVQVERVIHLSRECGAADLVAMVKQGIAAGYYLASPLLCSTDGEQRATVAAYYQRLAAILKVENTTEAPCGPINSNSRDMLS